MVEPSRVALVDDHPLLSMGLRQGLENNGISARIAESSTVDLLLDDLASERPELVVLDYGLPHLGDGLGLVGPIRELGCRVAVLSGSSNRVALAACLEAGAETVISKDEGVDDILEAIARVLEGENVNRSANAALLQELVESKRANAEIDQVFGTLTTRERSVLSAMLEGLSAADMSDRDFVSVDTIRSQIRAVLRKLGVNSQLEAVALVHRLGWTPEPVDQN